jgi:hypothetical protein
VPLAPAFSQKKKIVEPFTIRSDVTGFSSYGRISPWQRDLRLLKPLGDGRLTQECRAAEYKPTKLGNRGRQKMRTAGLSLSEPMCKSTRWRSVSNGPHAHALSAAVVQMACHGAYMAGAVNLNLVPIINESRLK